MKQKEIVQKIVITRNIDKINKKENLHFDLINMDIFQAIGVISKLQNDLINGKISFGNKDKNLDYMG